MPRQASGLGPLSGVWEPFFGGGSQTVLHSAIARLLPILDALLGVIGYLIELIAAARGGLRAPFDRGRHGQ
jgi:hypothetical protein